MKSSRILMVSVSALILFSLFFPLEATPQKSAGPSYLVCKALYDVIPRIMITMYQCDDLACSRGKVRNFAICKKGQKEIIKLLKKIKVQRRWLPYTFVDCEKQGYYRNKHFSITNFIRYRNLYTFRKGRIPLSCK